MIDLNKEYNINPKSINPIENPTVPEDTTGLLFSLQQSANNNPFNARESVIDGVVAYQFTKSPTAKKEYEQAMRKYASITNDKDTLEFAQRNFLANEYRQVIDSYGVVKDSILYDPQLQRTLSSEDFDYVLGLRNLRENILGNAPSQTSRVFDFNEKMRELDIAFGKQEINFDEYISNLQSLKMQFDRDDDSEVYGALAQMVSDGWEALKANYDMVSASTIAGAIYGGTFGSVVPVAGNIVGGILGGLKGFGYGLSVAMFTDTYQRTNTQLAVEAMVRNPNLTQREALKETQTASAIIGSLDIIATVLTGGLAKTGVDKLVTNLAKNAVLKTGVSASAITATKPLKEALKSKTALFAKDLAKLTALNLGSEAVQAGIGEVAVANASDTEAKISNAMWGSAKESFLPTLILATAGATPNALARINFNQRSIKNNLDAVQETTIASNSKIVHDDPVTAEEIWNKAFNNEVLYLDANDVLNTFKENDIDYKTLGNTFKDLEDLAKKGEDLVIPKGTWATQVNATGLDSLLVKHLRATKDGKTTEDAAQQLNDELVARYNVLKSAVENNIVRDKELDYIQKDLFTNLSSHKGFSSQQVSVASMFISSMFKNLGDYFGISAKELYDKYKGKFGDYSYYDPYRNVPYDPLGVTSTQAEKLDVEFSKDADFLTLIHEFSHYTLETLARMNDSTDNPKFKKLFADFQKWAGYEGKWSDLDPNKRLKIHEDFVYVFLSHAMGVGATKDAPKMLQVFNNFMNKSLNDRFNIINDGAEKPIPATIENLYANRFDNNAPKADSGLQDFFNTIVNNDMTFDEVNADYPMDSIFKDSKVNLSDEDIKALDDSWSDAKLEARYNANAGSILNVVTIVKGYQSLNRTLKHIGKKLGFNAEIKKALTTIEGVKKLYDDEVSKLNKALDADGYPSDPDLKEFKANYEIVQTLKATAKINESEAKANLPKDVVKQLRSFGLLAKDGESLDNVNGLLNNSFKDVDPNAQYGNIIKLGSIPSRQSFVRNKAIANISATPDIGLGLKDVTDVINASFATDVRSKMLAKEFKVIQKLSNVGDKYSNFMANLKSLVAMDIGNTNVRDLKPYSYMNLAKKARRNQQKAMVKGDLEEVARQNILERMYLEKAKQSYAKVRTLERNIRNLKKTFNRSDEKASRYYDVNTFSIGRVILSNIGILPKGKNKLSRDFIVRFAPEKLDLFDKLVSIDTSAMSLEDMSIRDLESTIELLKNVQKLASLNRKFEVKGVKLSEKDIRSQLVEAINQHKDYGLNFNVKGGVTLEATKFSKFITKARTTLKFATTKLEQLCKEIDLDDNGAFTNYVYKPLRKALTDYKNMLNERINDLKNLEAKYPDAFKGERYVSNLMVKEEVTNVNGEKTVVTKPLVFGDTYKGASRTEVIGLLLHIGNASNRKKLCDGYGWTEQELNNFITQAIDDGFITKDVMDYVQGVWDIFKKANEGAQKAHLETKGYNYKEIPNNKIVTPWGIYQGGYVPAKVNQDRMLNARPIEIDVTDSSKQLYDLVPIADGFTKERTNAVRPLSRDLEYLLTGIQDLVKYQTVATTAVKIHRLLTAHDVSQALASKYGSIYKDVFANVLTRVANDRTTNDVNYNMATRILSNVINRTGAVIMSASSINVAQTFTNFSVAMTKVKGSYLLRNTAHRMNVKTISGMSDFMRTRFRDSNVLISEVTEDIIFSTNKFKKISNFGMKHAYVFQKKAQNYVDTVVWGGAYQEYMDNHPDMDSKILEQKAIEHADSVVRTTQGSFDSIDLSNIEASHPLLKSVVQFTGYFYTLSNLISSEAKLAGAKKRGFELFKRIAVVNLLGVILPSIMSNLIVRTLSNSWTTEDDDATDVLLDVTLYGTLKTYGSMIPVAGSLTTAILNEFQGKHYFNDTLFNVPVVTMASAIKRAYVNLANPNEETQGRHIRDALYLLGLWNPLLGQPARIAGYLYDAGMGNISTDLDSWSGNIDFVRGILTGKASETQKN